MEQYYFQAAKPIFYPLTATEARAYSQDAVHHYGFYLCHHIKNADKNVQSAVFALTARNVYRLYVNGKLVMHGPARTAHGYARVDEVNVLPYLKDGDNHFGIEVMVYGDVYNGYSNDCTLEAGMFVGELLINQKVVSATGTTDWSVTHLTSRIPNSERISHCREAAEIYTLDDHYYLWNLGLVTYQKPVVLDDAPVYLPHHALKPTLQRHFLTPMVAFGSCYIQQNKPLVPLFYENNPYYHSLTEHPLEDCRRTVDTTFGGVNVRRMQDSWLLEGECDKYVMFDGGESYVGFIEVNFDCAHAGIVDIVHSELLNKDGSIPYPHNLVTRLHVEAGTHCIITMEPYLARYIKIYFRGTGDVELFPVSMYDYTYPDEMRSGFQCSNDSINALYNAAKKTLILNTMDIFMDCPDRERGGWLCDSLWTARAAHMMLSDPSVEREFIENFLLTPAEGMFHGFFPEVYPALKPDYKAMTGITTWTFWLMCELCEYTLRTGDTYLRDTYRERVEAFVKGSQDFIGKSGLLERLPWVFIDWSLSNKGEYHQPISTPANALYAYTLTQLGMLYDRTDWVALGQGMRNILREAIIKSSPLGLSTLQTIPDALQVDDNGVLSPKDYVSESGMATSLWAGLFLPGEAPCMEDALRDCMGPAPVYAPDPNIGKSQIFIGLCIRLDLLSRFGMCDKLYDDLLAIYMPQIKDGPGTLWETQDFNSSSKCHGFTSHAGVHLMRDILGLGIPQKTATGYHITISPCICGLRFARGTMETPNGLVSLSWTYTGKAFALQASLPNGCTYDILLPHEVKCLSPEQISVDINVRP